MWPKPVGLSREATSSAWCGRVQPRPPALLRLAGACTGHAVAVCLFVCLQFRATLHNERSNRSHTILQLRIERPAQPSGSLTLPYPHLYPPVPSALPRRVVLRRILRETRA